MNSTIKHLFRGHLPLLLALLLFLNNSSSVLSCKSNFECLSLCCMDDKCEDSSDCKNQNSRIYIAISAVALVFLIAAIIYLVINLKEIKASVKIMQMEMAEKEEKNAKLFQEERIKADNENQEKEA
mmetsp:Transcript_34132/g.35432  ORF Transcript_34132/g.35432 Transcript_34132/m.35432 type:complete len:126 (-) Transcript_34132:140-517(-)